MTERSGFLSPYRVLDLCDHRGVLAGWMFGLLGADVIQVEPPGGSATRGMSPLDASAPPGERSLYWSAYASCRRSITCQLDSAAGRALFLRLVATADFVFESAAPGEMAHLGLDYAALRAVNPALIHVSITPFGASGPKAHYADSELVLWASAGPLFPNRDNRGVPLRISVPQAYLHGAADAAAGALLALFARHQSGLGQHVDVSTQQSAALCTLSTTLAAAVGHANYQFPAEATGKKKSLDLSGSGARTRRSKWPVRDGLLELHLGIGPASGGSANKVFAWMREEGALPAAYADWDWITLPARIQADEIGEEQLEAAREMVGAFVARYSKAELMQIALTRGILMAPALTVGDLAESEQLRARGFFVTVQQQGMERRIPQRFAAGCDQGFTQVRAAPAVGEHNESVYCGLLGLTAAELAALAGQGAV